MTLSSQTIQCSKTSFGIWAIFGLWTTLPTGPETCPALAKQLSQYRNVPKAYAKFLVAQNGTADGICAEVGDDNSWKRIQPLAITRSLVTPPGIGKLATNTEISNHRTTGLITYLQVPGLRTSTSILASRNSRTAGQFIIMNTTIGFIIYTFKIQIYCVCHQRERRKGKQFI